MIKYKLIVEFVLYLMNLISALMIEE